MGPTSMSKIDHIPASAYGVLHQDSFILECEEIAERVRRLGFAIVDSGFTQNELQQISSEFDLTHNSYIEKWGQEYLKGIDELNTIRVPLAYGYESFLKLLMNERIMEVVKRLIDGKFILNQQNGVINPSGQVYNQGAWHRDLPYQHFTSSTPLAINALFCVDDFTSENGSTFVIPGSHKFSSFPSQNYIKENAHQVSALAGQYILLDCMLFHSGGFNASGKARRAVNHVYNIPFFKQQIRISEMVDKKNLSPEHLEILGFNFQEPLNLEQYFSSRMKLDA